MGRTGRGQGTGRAGVEVGGASHVVEVGGSVEVMGRAGEAELGSVGEAWSGSSSPLAFLQQKQQDRKSTRLNSSH